MNKILIILIIVELIIVVVLKLFNMYYHKKIEYLDKLHTETAKNEELLSSKISYNKYKEISKKASIPNSPVRTNGDFVDFFISHMAEDPNLVENNIMNIDYEEVYE